MDNLIKKPHKHAALIKAWAYGAEIEYFSKANDRWVTMPSNMGWYNTIGYRIKEAEKPNTVMEVLIVLSSSAGPLMYAAAPSEANCKLVFDGTTGKLTGAAPIQASEALKQPSEASYNHHQWLGSLNQFKRTGEL